MQLAIFELKSFLKHFDIPTNNKKEYQKMEINQDLVKSFAFYGGILAFKTLLMSGLTARQRFAKKVK